MDFAEFPFFTKRDEHSIKENLLLTNLYSEQDGHLSLLTYKRHQCGAQLNEHPLQPVLRPADVGKHPVAPWWGVRQGWQACTLQHSFQMLPL